MSQKSDSTQVVKDAGQTLKEFGQGLGVKIGQFIGNPAKDTYTLIAFAIIALVVFTVISWVISILNLNSKGCSNLDKIYPTNNSYITQSIFADGTRSSSLVKSSQGNNFFNDQDKCLFRNYYVKTAYNCCCGDGYKNNFVNLCALEKCITQGARCLDFEIYSYNNEPIVAASTVNNNSIKETFNYLRLTDVFDILNTNAFSNNYDPMILHFRILSENAQIYDKIADYIESNLISKNIDYLLENKYTISNPGYSDNIDVLLTTSINKIKLKYIIAVNTLSKSVLYASKLIRYANFKSGESKFKLYRYEEVLAAGAKNPLNIAESQIALVIVLPTLDNTLDNYDYTIPLENGAQFIAMKFQNMDSNLIAYNQFFKDKGGYSFVLKPPPPFRIDIASSQTPSTGAELSGQNARTTIGGTL